VGMLHATFHTLWQKALTGLLAAGAIIGWPLNLLRALSGFAGTGRDTSARLIVMMLMLVALRAIALWRWNSIDWSHFRTIPKSGTFFRRT
jgi:hypothetical protein